MISLDKAIEFYKEYKNRSSGTVDYNEFDEQLGEWLEELKAYRENSNGYSKEDIELNRKAMYNKALDDCIKEVEEEEKQHNHTITKDCLFWLKRKLEQMKGTARK